MRNDSINKNEKYINFLQQQTKKTKTHAQEIRRQIYTTLHRRIHKLYKDKQKHTLIIYIQHSLNEFHLWTWPTNAMQIPLRR